MKRLVFTVTNDLTYDQRMIRICTSLSSAGYDVLLIGRTQKGSVPLTAETFQQKRLRCIFERGKAFYAEYNIRLFFLLLLTRADLLCAIDLDTILAVYFASWFKRTKRVYDAHELFCEMKEIVTRPGIYKIWKRIERFAVPRFRYGYTVNQILCDEFAKMYGRNYEAIRNLPVLTDISVPAKDEKYVLYQGAVNEGRSFETLIPAFSKIPYRLLIAGDGNFIGQAKKLTIEHQLSDKVVFLGKLPPDELRSYTLHAWVGVTLFENKGLSNYYSLANRFFDYIHSGVPQLCVEYPAYVELNKSYKIAVLIKDLSSQNIALHLSRLINDDGLYQELQQNCLKARQELNWQNEERKLISYYKQIFQS